MMMSIPDFNKEFERYYRNIISLREKGRSEQKKVESAKMKEFFSFLERVTGLKPEEYSYDAFVVKGSKPDAVTGNVVVEFEDDLSLSSEVREAEEQLRKYIRDLYSKEARRYWAIASDGILFIIYRVVIKDGELSLERMDIVDITKEDPRRFYWFIYEYFFEERFHCELKPEDFVIRFGYGSRVFRDTLDLLRKLWSTIANTAYATTLFNEWSKYYAYVTGKEYKDVELFLRHTYLAILAKILAYIYLEEGVGARLGDIKTLEKVLTGEFFRNLGLEIFERDYFSWVIADEIKDDFMWGIHNILLKELLLFDYSKLDTDVFKEIYQNIIEHDERASLGEYYTPDFIAELMLRDLLSKNPQARVLDPGCGSGTFLFITIRLKKEQLKEKLAKHELLNHILNSVIGIDINPVAVIVARANYLIAIRDLLPARGRLRIPVYLANAIVIPEREEDKLLISVLNKSIDVIRIKAISENEYFYLPGYSLIPKLSVEDLDTLIEFTEDVAKLVKEHTSDEKLVREIRDKYVAKAGKNLSYEEQAAISYILLHNAKLLRKYMSEKRNTFWLFLLRNQYKVFLLREQFDIVIGNPPWVSRTDVESERFREWYDNVLKHYGMSLRPELMGAPADTVIPFIMHCVSYYLKQGGYLYFVVPASVMRGQQYEVLREEPGVVKIHKIVNLEKVKIHDLSKGRVDTIFNVPCILMLIRKESERSVKDIEGEVYEGTVVHRSKNVPYNIFVEAVERRNVKVYRGVFIKGVRGILTFRTHEEPETSKTTTALVDQLIAMSKQVKSPYLKRVVAGVSAYPRNFVLAQIPTPKYGLDLEHIYVKTHPRAIEHKGEGEEKEKWRQVLEGKVPARYLYLLVTGDNVFPFGVWGLNIAVLPVRVNYEKNEFEVLTPDETIKELEEWYLRGINEYFKDTQKREPSDEDIRKFITWLLRERLNYQNKFSKQKPIMYSVIYNTSGDALNMGSAVIDKRQLLIEANKYLQKILGINEGIQILSGIVIDYTNYVIDFKDHMEAHYLCVMLQSTPIREAVHRVQPRGKKGGRHITDLPLRMPIPEFIRDEVADRMKKQGVSDGDIEYLKSLQLELANLSMELHRRVQELLDKYIYKNEKYGVPFINNTDKILAPQSVATIRGRIRHEISDYQKRIDELSVEVLNLALKINAKPRTLLDYFESK